MALKLIYFVLIKDIMLHIDHCTSYMSSVTWDQRLFVEIVLFVYVCVCICLYGSVWFLMCLYFSLCLICLHVPPPISWSIILHFFQYTFSIQSVLGLSKFPYNSRILF